MCIAPFTGNGDYVRWIDGTGSGVIRVTVKGADGGDGMTSGSVVKPGGEGAEMVADITVK